MMIYHYLLSLGVEKTGGYIVNAFYHIEIQTAYNIGLINKLFGFIGIGAKNNNIISTGKSHKKVGSRIGDNDYCLLAMGFQITAHRQR